MPGKFREEYIVLADSSTPDGLSNVDQSFKRNSINRIPISRSNSSEERRRNLSSTSSSNSDVLGASFVTFDTNATKIPAKKENKVFNCCILCCFPYLRTVD